MSKKILDKKASLRMQEQYVRFYLNLRQFSELLRVHATTASNWKRKEPTYGTEQRKIMIRLGINPLYCDGYGEIYLHGFTREQVEENIQNELKKIYEERKKNSE